MKSHLRMFMQVFVILVVAEMKAQDSRAYAKEDVPLSHSLEAKTPSEAWEEVKNACNHFPPSVQSETSGNLVAGDLRTKYIESWLIATADKAQEFYTKFPNDTNAATAKFKELDVLYEAFNETYSTNLFPRMFARANAIVRDTNLDRTNRFKICYSTFIITVENRNLLPPSVDLGAELEADARIAERDFSDLAEVSLLSMIAKDINEERTRPPFREFSAILQKMADDRSVRGYVFRGLTDVLSSQRDAIDRPRTLEFTNFAGLAVDTAQMKGKVIAVDFWGNLYPESTSNVIHLEDLYREFHSKGLEVIGVNVDHDSETLKNFISEHKIEWPQYWDGKEVENKLVQAAHVTRANTILLIDKKGRLRDIYGNEDLDKKIGSLLRE